MLSLSHLFSLNLEQFDEKFDKGLKIRNIKLQRDFSGDNKRKYRKKIVHQSPFCKIHHNQSRISGKKGGNNAQTLIKTLRTQDFQSKNSSKRK
jgi:hypothetical protein